VRRALETAALVALVLLAACVPELNRVFPDRGGGSDDLPVWSGSDQPTHIGISDQSPASDAVALHTKPDLLTADQRPPDQQPPDQNSGKWYQANQKNCPTHCGSLDRVNVPGPEGAHCMSGEVRSGSGIAQGISFPWGCFGGCTPMGPHQAVSVGDECYKPGQKQDGDSTDRTVGCYCR
jgi:hypothetical protein